MRLKNVEDVYILGPMQQGILFHMLYESRANVYFSQFVCTIDQPFDVTAFRLAWQQMLARHSVLRTAFLWDGLDEPLQIVNRQVELPWEYMDWQNLPVAEQQARLEAFLASDRERGFDLAVAPLWRLYLIQMAEQTYTFISSSSHLLMDGWSRALLLQEVSASYQANLHGRSLRLPRARPYRDYIGWLQRQNLGKAEDYWRNVLRDFTTPTTLAGAYPHTTTKENGRESSYARSELRLSAEQTTALHTFTRQQQITLNTLLQGAWAMVLNRYSGERDIVFGVTIAGRPASLPRSETMVGLFINTLPLRTQVRPEAHLVSWLKCLQEQQAAMLEYQYTPLVQIQGWSAIPREQHLFESILVFENTLSAVSWQQIQGVNFQDMRGGVEHTNYPLTLTVGPDSELLLRLAYDANRFDAGTIAGVLGHLRNLLEHIAAMPPARLSDYSILSAAEQRKILYEWNQTQQAYPTEQCIQSLFEKQVLRSPDAIAVVFENEQITCHELNRRANHLAQHLRAQGVRPEQRVGLCVEVSPELVIGMLGILKVGGAYLPLDPTNPPARLATLLHDADVSVLLTQRHLIAQCSLPVSHIVCLDSDWQTLATRQDTNPAHDVHPANAAYVLYTSGSTGAPRGVIIEHRAILNYYFAIQQRLGLSSPGSFAMLQPLTVDSCLTMLFPALLSGSPLHLISRDLAVDAHGLATTLSERPADYLKIAPSHLAVLLRAEGPEHILPRRKLIIGGEASHWQWVQQVASRLPPGSLYNHYGPTETTVGVLTYPVATDEQPIQDEVTPIGTPLANIQVYVLDRQMQPVPPGVVGELYLGGAGLARGYLGRADQTAERFVPHPFSQQEGARLYRTGDQVRSRSDGVIAFVGRADDQIKLRGYRIELGEIVAALRQQETLRDVVVLAREDVRGEKRLVAYVVTQDKTPFTIEDMRNFLHTKLPAYMIPSALVCLENLPLLPHGKVDRRAFPAPDAHDSRLNESVSAFRNPIEELLAELWAKLLEVKQVGADDNFFELGGHSLLAIRAISHLRKVFHVELPLRSLFEVPTVSGMATFILEQMKQTKKLQAPALLGAPRTEPSPLSFAQQRLWFLDQLEPGTSLYNVRSVEALQGPLDSAAFERGLQEIVRRHEVLHTTFIIVDDVPRQSIASALSVPLPVVDLQALPPPLQQVEVHRLGAQEAQRPFDLARGPLLRVTLLRLAPQEHVLLLTMHHTVSDEWSVEIFGRELNLLYRAYSRGEISPLADLPIQYADFAYWQRQWLQGEVLQTQLDYWREHLRGMPTILEMPTDHPRPSVRTYQGGIVSFTFPTEVSDALKALSLREGVTLFMTLLAAFQTLLARYSGLEDIVVGSPITNRTSVETEGLIGLFLNTLVLRTNLSGNPTFQELLRRVREVALEAYTHQDLPFERLVDELSPERDLSRNPLFQVMFVLQNVSATSAELGDLTRRSVFIERGMTKFDLSLFLANSADGIEGMFAYNRDLFEADSIEQITAHFLLLLKEIVASPQQRVFDLPILTPTEQRLIQERNDTRAEYPQGVCLHELVEEQVLRSPDAVAVVFENAQMSYDDLNRRANQLAHHLRAQGVGPEHCVGIGMEHSLEMVIGVLGILKAGGAYLPLDPASPPARLMALLQDAGVCILLTQQSLRTQFGLPLSQMVCLDIDGQELAAQPDGNPTRLTHPANAAYVLYTSGSTGSPKGVVVEHRAILNYCFAVQQRLGLHAPGSFAMLQPLTVDSCLTMLFPALLCGGSLHLLPRERAIDAHALATSLGERPADYLKIAPSHLAALLTAEGSDQLLPRRRLIIGGEASSWSWVQQLAARLPAGSLYNHYGPTETTVGVLTYPVGGQASASQGEVTPLGIPLPNIQAYVLDRQMRPVPPGVMGEICLGGAGLARGYLGHTEQTAERFVPHPWSQQPGARLYRTGDLARCLPDGTIVFVGRRDEQIKLRGYRIELGEIEATLRQHEALRDVVVLARQDAQGEKRLVAYVTLQEGEAFTRDGMQRFLAASLPDYMIPTLLVCLENLPLSSHGKVDRQRLPSPAWESLRPEVSAEPTTEYEKILAGIWAETLVVERVGVDTNFFELGGDSIKTLLIVARARQAGLLFTPRQLFQHQTIRELAAILEGDASLTRDHERGQGLLPLLPWQARFFEQQCATPQHWDQTVCLLEIVATRLVPELLQETFAHLVERQAALRLRFTHRTQEWKQSLASEETQAASLVRFLDLSALSRDEQTRAISEAMARLQTSVHVETGPLLGALHVNYGSSRPEMLLIVVHRLAIDHTSCHILVEELGNIYAQCERGITVQQPSTAVAFKRWCERLHSLANSPELAQEASTWLALGSQDVLLLPLDVDLEPQAQTDSALCRVQRSLGIEETRELLEEVPGAYHTQTHEVLLTALLLACAPWIGQHRLLVMLEEPRCEELFSDIDISHVIGCFTGSFPALLDLERLAPSTLSHIDLGQVLKAVKEQVRRFPRSGIGYDALRYVRSDPATRSDLAALAQPQVSFQYLGAFDSTRNVSGSNRFRLSQVDFSPSLGAQEARQQLLDIYGLIANDQLCIHWLFNAHLHRRQTIELLAERFLERLRALIAHCRTPGTGDYTASDFPESGLNQAMLNKALGKLRPPKKAPGP
ncbi:MAG: amino acid adenylation domain-containing protein [Ktedonobacteraceae bacterium]|nr:amino acid adenylation domain-containing protein [Ktedonobacteraceae bacterium]